MAPAELVADLCLRWSRGNIWRIDWPGDVDGIVFIGTEDVVVYNYNTAEWIWNLKNYLLWQIGRCDKSSY